MAKMKLTIAQERALKNMSTTDWKCAYSIGARIPTLDALVKKGEAKKRSDNFGLMFSPRTSCEYIAVERTSK